MDEQDFIMATATGLHYDDGGSVVIFAGIENETGSVIHFAVEARHANALFYACADGESPQVAVPDWAVVRRFPVTA